MPASFPLVRGLAVCLLTYAKLDTRENKNNGRFFALWKFAAAGEGPLAWESDLPVYHCATESLRHHWCTWLRCGHCAATSRQGLFPAQPTTAKLCFPEGTPVLYVSKPEVWHLSCDVSGHCWFFWALTHWTFGLKIWQMHQSTAISHPSLPSQNSSKQQSKSMRRNSKTPETGPDTFHCHLLFSQLSCRTVGHSQRRRIFTKQPWLHVSGEPSK